MLIITATLLIFNIVTILNNSNVNTNKINANPSNTQGSGEEIAKVMDCFNNPDEQQKCLDTFIENYFGSKTTKEVLADLERARLTSSSIENSCHPIAHAIGRATYKKIGNVGDAFESCDQSCHSGCYHGVMERLFYDDEEIATKTHLTYSDMEDKIPGICNADKFKNPTNAVIFQCLHGVGHAILYSLDYNLTESLKSCDLLETQYEKSSCYGGVVMENITAFDKKKRWMKPEDPLYPCNILEDKFKSDCYTMQTSIMFEYGMTIPDIAANCNKTEGYESQCFVSLGRDLSNYVRSGSIEYVRNACEDLSPGREMDCITGSMYALIDNTWDGRFAYQFCNSLQNEGYKNECYKNSNSYLQWSYAKTKTDVEDNCKQYAGSELNRCLQTIF